MTTQKYAIIDANGYVLRTGSAPQNMITQQAKAGQQAVIVQTMPDARLEKYVNGQWVSLSQAEKDALRLPITADHVNAERVRRMDVGVIVTVSGYGDVALQGRDTDKISLLGLKDVAVMRIQAGDTTTTTKFRDRDNVDHFLTPPQIVELWQNGIAWLETIYNRSWDLKSMDPIPFDYQDEGYWT